MATIDILLVGGGGAGGWGAVTGTLAVICGAGGGAGGYRYIPGQEIVSGVYPIIIGSGGTGTYSCIPSEYPIVANGGDTIFSGITASGGGAGGGHNQPNFGIGRRGGCGGGTRGHRPYGGSYPYNYGARGYRYNGFVDNISRGGSGGNPKQINGADAGSGGGGGGAHGIDTTDNGVGGAGGAGLQCPIDNNWYSGGGGGGGLTPSSGGLGGGGTSGSGSPVHAGYDGTPNTGGGGGGGYGQSGEICYHGPGGNGGSGIVKIRYITSEMYGATGGSKTTSGIYTIHTFTSNDNFTITVNPVASPTSTPVPSITPSITPTSCINYPITIRLHDSELDAGPFDLYSNVDNFTIPFETGLSRDLLLYGITSYNSPCYTKIVRVMSNGYCITSVDLTTTDPYPTPNMEISMSPTPTMTVTPSVSFEAVLHNQQGIFSSGWYKIPENVYFIQVETWGAGGGGSARTTMDPRLSGGGGGGGAYAKRMAMAVTPLTYYYFNVGIGGVSEHDGTYSSFTGDTEMVLASGGHSSNSAAPGIGAYSSECIGDIIYSGGSGGYGDSVYIDFSGGGGGGSPAADHYHGVNGGNFNGVYGGAGAVSRGGVGGDGAGNCRFRECIGGGHPGSYGGGGGGVGANNSGVGGTGGNGYFVVSFVVAPEKPISAPYLLIPATITESGWYKIPIGVSSIKVECRGIGGNGTSSYGSIPGRGGYGGSYAKVQSISVIENVDYLFLIGTIPGYDNFGSYAISWYSPAFMVGENNQKCLAGCGESPRYSSTPYYHQLDNCIGEIIYSGGTFGDYGVEGGGGGGEGAGSTSHGGNGADGGAVLGGAGGSGTDGGDGGVGGTLNGYDAGNGNTPGGGGGGSGRYGGNYGIGGGGQIDIDFF